MSYIKELLELNYEECVANLKNKYGLVSGDYFLDDKMTKKNTKIGRGKEGLYIHHIDEDKAIMLSTSSFAAKNPGRWQWSDRLVYCNLVEHLLLHLKIFEYPNQNKNPEAVGVGGIYNFIVPELNDIYSGIEYKQPWKQKVIEVVMPLKDDYLSCIKKLVELNFHYPLLSSFYFNQAIGWSEDKNKAIFKELKKLGVKY